MAGSDPDPEVLLGGGSPYARGAPFWKVSGSGNDFVAFDRMEVTSDAPLPTPDQVRALCHRRFGVGADGVIVLRRGTDVDFELVYFNADGSRADLCGNASLCSIRLASELGYAASAALRFRTDAGVMTGRIADGLPEFDLAPPTEIATDRADLGGAGVPGDRIGFALVGVPHVVIRCRDVDDVDLGRVGPQLRHHPALAHGANVNVASTRADGTVALRTFERGVEAETLACGTGSVATAILLGLWSRGASSGAADTSLETRSGMRHRVRTTADASGRLTAVSLAGSARIVFHGVLGEVQGA